MENDIIFHIDVNSAFLSWTAADRLQKGDKVDLRQIPSIIGGDMTKRHGVVLAKSIPAKAYGIATGEPVANAMRKCPSLVCAAPDHKMYSEKSHALMEYLMQICPEIEQVSIDECFMNYTPIRKNYASPESAAHIIKDTIREKFGFTVNIGISDRKVLAKMASDFKKPDLVHTLYSREIRQKMWPLPVSSLFMCGRSSAAALHNLGIRTIGDLACTPVDILEAHLKSHGRLLWEYANGKDSSGLFSEPAKAKGISHSLTLSADVLSKEAAYKILLTLSEAVTGRLRSSAKLAGMVCTEIKYATFRSVSHQCILPTATASTKVVYETACRLFDELWDGSAVRLLGIRLSHFTAPDEPVQMSLFDLSPSEKNAFGQAASEKKLVQLDKTLDHIRSRFGNNAIKRGSLLNSPDSSSSK